jgi:hypothetical protein
LKCVSDLLTRCKADSSADTKEGKVVARSSLAAIHAASFIASPPRQAASRGPASPQASSQPEANKIARSAREIATDFVVVKGAKLLEAKALADECGQISSNLHMTILATQGKPMPIAERHQLRLDYKAAKVRTEAALAERERCQLYYNAAVKAFYQVP